MQSRFFNFHGYLPITIYPPIGDLDFRLWSSGSRDDGKIARARSHPRGKARKPGSDPDYTQERERERVQRSREFYAQFSALIIPDLTAGARASARIIEIKEVIRS